MDKASGSSLTTQQIQQVVEGYFAELESYHRGDIISQTDVVAVLQRLGEQGWQPADRQQIVADTLPDANSVVALLRTDKGRRFMHKVSSYRLIYDRLDRISQVSGGQRTIEAIVRLPDGEKYALPKKQTPLGVPDFLDLLPKNASGKVRSIKDYQKPTGRIYTEADLVKRLTRSREPASDMRP